jgi:hypothetical protein
VIFQLWSITVLGVFLTVAGKEIQLSILISYIPAKHLLTNIKSSYSRLNAGGKRLQFYNQIESLDIYFVALR